MVAKYINMNKHIRWLILYIGATFLTLLIEILQVAADVDGYVLHLHVLQTGEFVHVLEKFVVLTGG